MREVFLQELAEVQERLIEIAQLVADSMQSACDAFNNQDIRLAERVIENDPEIDRLALNLDELAITIIAKQQPVARDLRIVVSALRMSSSLERMGDMAEHIAQMARTRYPQQVIDMSLSKTFQKMAKIDIEMARKLVRVLQTEDPALVEEIRNDDDRVDDLHLHVFETVLGEAWRGDQQSTIDATLASRYFERFADHVESIAKKVLYLATGNWSEANLHETPAAE